MNYASIIKSKGKQTYFIHTKREVLFMLALFILLLPLMVILECAKKS